MSIQETLQKIKRRTGELPETLDQAKKLLNSSKMGYFAAGISLFTLILIGLFLLGRISALRETPDRTVTIEYPPLVETNIPKYQETGVQPENPSSKTETKNAKPKTIVTTTKEPTDWGFAASRTGKTYYPKDCKGLTRVKLENRVYFKTSTQAETAGLTLSKSCNK